MKVAIVVGAYKRREVFDIFLEGVTRLIENVPTVETHAFISVSPYEEDDELYHFLAMRNHPRIHFIETENRPLGKKMNTTLAKAREIAPDYVMVMGSDNLMSTKTYMDLVEQMQAGYDLVGLRDMHFLVPEASWNPTPKMYYYGGYVAGSRRSGETLGVGRCLSNKLLKKLGWAIWDSRVSSRLDESVMLNLKGVRYSKKRIDSDFCLDIKTSVNINQVRPDYDKSDVLIMGECLPPVEVTMIERLTWLQ